MRALALLLLLPGAVPSELPWEKWFSAHGVDVEIARGAGPPWIRGSGEIEASAERVAAVIGDFGRYREIFSPAVKRADVLSRSADGARLHLVWPYPFPLRNRDAVVLYRLERSDGDVTLSWRADAQPGDPAEGVRIDRVAGETRVAPAGPGRCRLTYTYLGDLGGKFPASAMEKAWREEPVQYFRALKRALGLKDREPSGRLHDPGIVAAAWIPPPPSKSSTSRSSSRSSSSRSRSTSRPTPTRLCDSATPPRGTWGGSA